MDKKELKNPSKKYRPVPFWSWNEKLDTKETVRQVREMEKAGLGGYFMHARGGLQTEYMSDEWFKNVEAACDVGEKIGMLSWGYDENGWPSGFGSGYVNGLGEEYQQKYLRLEISKEEKATPHTIANLKKDGKNLHFFYEVNPFYVDVLNEKVIAEFLKTTYDAYLKKMGEKFVQLTGFFTDEPQISRKGFPWSLILANAYQERYGEDLISLLPSLYFDEGDYKKVRYRYWALVTDLFAESYMKQIGSWCEKHGCELTGHMLLEEDFSNQILSSGACMPSYEYMTVPGMDWLRRKLADIQVPMQVSSVANQLGKKQTLSETFAMCGWNVSLEELRNIYEHQMVHGINLLCQHLEGYSLRGLRKRDYPASLYTHQPWWQDYKIFNDTVSRIGYLVAEGKAKADVLVLHNIRSAWTILRDSVTEETYKGLSNPADAEAYCLDLHNVMESLEDRQIQYHLGDETILSRHGKVEKKTLLVGEQHYRVVIVPKSETISDHTYRLLNEFHKQGGTVLFIEQVPRFIEGVETDALKWGETIPIEKLSASLPSFVSNIRIEGAEAPLNTLVRSFDDTTVYYIHNRNSVKQSVKAYLDGSSCTHFDPICGEEENMPYTLENGKVVAEFSIEPKSSYIIFAYSDSRQSPAKTKKREQIDITHKLKGTWEIVSDEDNLLTLDFCDAVFDDTVAYENIPVTDLQEIALAYGKKVHTKITYHFHVQERSFTRLKLVVETPEIFKIKINGIEIENNVIGTIFDSAFQMIDIAALVKDGENKIEMECDFEQSPEVYEMAEKSLYFESERNKLYFDMQIEAVYLCGDFSVESSKDFKRVENRALVTDGIFSITKKNTRVSDGEVISQGYPFFAGSMTFQKKVNLTKEEAESAILTFADLCSTVTTVRINGKNVGKILWHPYSLDLSPFCRAGENVIEIQVTGNLRNMLGPFHLKEGECLGVSPRSFQHQSRLWSRGPNTSWTNSYCFVDFGLFFPQEQ